jgi:hypothetical protein
MAVIQTTPSKIPPPSRLITPTIPTFEKWAEGRTGFTKGELQEIYATVFGLPTEKVKELEEKTKTKTTEILKPKEVKKPIVAPPANPKVEPKLIIERIGYPKWWKDSLNATIDFSAPGSAILATVSGKLRLYVATIIITVTGETVLTITFGTAGSSGPIYLGGENQPMGIVIAMGNSPAPCGRGPLSITATDPSDATPSIGGWATCFAEEG